MSIWGVNQALASPQVATAGSDVACAAGTETNVISASLPVGFSGFNAVLFADVACVIVLGATAPTALVIAARLGAGADVDSYTVSPAALVANAILQLSPALVASLSRSSAGGNGTWNITVNATGQAVTLKANARCLFSYGLGVDS